jgi:hypothetical protein
MQDSIDAGEYEVVNELARSFYSIVPAQYRTYCALTASIAREALRRFGFEWELLPCQLWYAGPDRNHIVGFSGRKPEGNAQWDGHVVCASARWFMDTTLDHLRVSLGIQAPILLVGNRFQVTSQTIARHDLGPGERLWWLHPPTGADTRVPGQPLEVVERMAAALHVRVQRRLLERQTAGTGS